MDRLSLGVATSSGELIRGEPITWRDAKAFKFFPFSALNMPCIKVFSRQRGGAVTFLNK
jgi:hypothetical protein